MSTLVALAPASGSRLRMLGTGLTHVVEGGADVPYALDMVTRPVWVDGALGIFRAMGIEIRHYSAVELTITPIVDGVTFSSQAKTIALAAPNPAEWRRVPREVTFHLAGRKFMARVQSGTLSGLFHLDGGYVDVTVHPNYLHG